MTERVVAVTGGGAGIGAAIAEEIGRNGCFVVTVDPLVTLDGSAPLDAPTETTADRIVAAGGKARASGASVTNRAGVQAVFDELIGEFGADALFAVVNVAGISRPTSYVRGSDEDWRAVLEVHLDGYLNVLHAALPIMEAAGRGIVLGVTSGSGWRIGDAGSYGCAKRAVASLTWQIGRHAPAGVAVNAMSPIAVTRMVTAALERAGKSANDAGPLFGAMPQPEEIGPLGAFLATGGLQHSGQIIFAGGSEAAVVDQPRLLEVVQLDGVSSVAHLLEAVVSTVFAAAEASQLSGGGSNPRFNAAYDDGDLVELPASVSQRCAVVTDDAEWAAAIAAALDARSVLATIVASADMADLPGGLDGFVVALSPTGTTSDDDQTWQTILAEHDGIVDDVFADAKWSTTVANYAIAAERPVRIVTLTDARSFGGRSRAQSVAQHARSARKATKDLVSAFAVSVEGARATQTAELAAHLVCSPDAPTLSGAELVAGPGWFGIRSHPRAGASFNLGGAAIPDWFGAALNDSVGP